MHLLFIDFKFYIIELTELREQKMPWHGKIFKWMCAKLEYASILIFFCVTSFQFLLLFIAFGHTIIG